MGYILPCWELLWVRAWRIWKAYSHNTNDVRSIVKFYSNISEIIMINIAEIIKRFPEDFKYYNILTGECSVKVLEDDSIYLS